MFLSTGALLRALSLTLLLVLHMFSIVLSSMPLRLGSESFFLILQVILDGVSLGFILGLICYVFAKRLPAWSVALEMISYGIIYIISMGSSILVTVRWGSGDLRMEFRKVSQGAFLVVLLPIMSWAVTGLSFVGFILACTTTVSKNPLSVSSISSESVSKPKVRPGSLPIQSPPVDTPSRLQFPWKTRDPYLLPIQDPPADLELALHVDHTSRPPKALRHYQRP